MLHQQRTQIRDTREVDMIASTTINEEGLVIQGEAVGGLEQARVSDGENAMFLGIAFGERYGPPSTLPRVEQITASGVTATLSKAAIAGSLTVIIGTGYSGDVLDSSNSAPSATEFKLESNGTTVTLHANNADDVLFVVYRYNATVSEIQALYGDSFPGVRASNALSRVGMITNGIVYTDSFDTAVNWGDAVANPASVIKGATGGRVSIGGATGCVIVGHVISAPTAGDPWLGLSINL